MSLFDFPRINFKGTLQLNPGTANNDDYAQQPGAALIPQSFGPPYAGQALGLIDSKTVQPRTFGMSDADFIAWVQKIQTFDVSGSSGQTKQIPAEWNYYGDMTSRSLSIKAVGVQTAPDKVYAKVDPGVAATSVIGATLTYSGNITDVNSEGSPPATQFFIEKMVLQGGATPLLSGTASKGACQWLNFYRNVNLTQDGGAGGYVYHVMRKSDGAIIKLPGFDDPAIIGVICRYYLYRRAGGASSKAAIEALYAQQKTNPAVLEIAGTFAPLYADEKIVTGPVGRLLISNDCNIPTPPGSSNNSVINNDKGLIALAPAVLQRNGNAISVDFSGTFPDYAQSDTGPNPKWNFGAVTLVVSNATGNAPIGPVDYADTACRRWPRLDLRFRHLVEYRRAADPAGPRGDIQPDTRGDRHRAGGDRLLFRLEPAGHLRRAKRPGRLLPEPGDQRAGNNLGLPSRPRTRLRRMPSDHRLAVPFRSHSDRPGTLNDHHGLQARTAAHG